MRIRLGDLRKIIIEELKSQTTRMLNQPYDSSLLDDGFEKKSVYVPDDIKKRIKKWAKDMKLSM